MSKKIIVRLVTTTFVLLIVSTLLIMLVVKGKDTRKGAIVESCINITKSRMKSPNSFSVSKVEIILDDMKMEDRVEKADEANSEMIKNVYMDEAFIIEDGLVILKYLAKNIYGVELESSSVCAYEVRRTSFEIKAAQINNQFYSADDIHFLNYQNSRRSALDGFGFKDKFNYAKYRISGKLYN